MDLLSLKVCVLLKEKNEEKAFGELQVTKSVAFISFSQLLTHLPSSLSLVKGPCMSYKCTMSSAVSEVESTILHYITSTFKLLIGPILHKMSGLQ